MNFIYLLLLAVCISLTNCEGNSTLEESQNSKELALIDFEKQISDIRSNLSNDKSTSKSKSYVAATFDIRMEGDNYIIENVEYLNEFEYGFAQGFSKSASRYSVAGGDIAVYCEKTGETKTCKKQTGIGAGMRQAKCVGGAVKKCLDAGGCAQVCDVEARMLRE